MSSPQVSRFATLVLKLLVSTKDRTFLDHARWAILFKLRSFLVGAGDPIVEYELHGAGLRMPLSHNLPLILRTFPLYSDNLGRIAALLSTKYPDLSVIDIGANVGDSVAMIHHHTHVPILCIEGEPKFGGLLGANVSTRVPAPVIEESFVGTGGNSLSAFVQDGTARLAPAGAGAAPAIRMKPLEQILQEHPSFQRSRLLKIDTDGMDVAILQSALGWISRARPVLFFEYDPDLQRTHGAGGLELLGELGRLGYRRVLVYESIGDYMFSAELENKLLLSELHEYFSGRASTKYCDLCVFHSEDDDIAEALRRRELNFFRTARRYSPPPDHLSSAAVQSGRRFSEN